MKLKKSILFALSLFSILTLVACDDDSSVGVSEDKYNEQVNQYNDLVKKYNETVSSGADTSKTMTNYMASILNLDDKMKEVSSAYFGIKENSACSSFSDFNTKKANALKQIVSIESDNLSLVQTLRKNAEHLYKQEKSQAIELLNVSILFHKQLSGFRSILDNMETDITLKSPKACNISVEKEIQLSQKETEILDRMSSGTANAIYRHNGSTQVQSGRSGILEYARNSGFDNRTASQNLDIAELSNGVLGMATSSAELTDIMVDQLAIFKNKMNANTDHLELALIIDYSGSMSNNINEVITNLIKLNKGLEAVKNSGRKVKIAIVTFGAPGSEKIDLDFTDNLTEVDRVLRVLLAKFSSNNHSTDPGEASYHGLTKALSGLKWNSSNREIILVTDEPSYEASTGMTTYINNAKALLANTAINPIIVKLNN